MPFAALENPPADLGEMLVTLAASEGSASHPYTHSGELNADRFATRNLADVLHLLSMLHGVQPAAIEVAGMRNVIREADAWFTQAAAGFAVERAYLAQLSVTAGPVPSTPGEAETAAAVMGQRHALDTIAHSERHGCALGAAAALTLDWQAIRAVLDTAAVRLGIGIPASLMPDEDATTAVVAAIPFQPRLDRTIGFGARQLLIQHRGLWELLATRAGARAELELG